MKKILFIILIAGVFFYVYYARSPDFNFSSLLHSFEHKTAISSQSKTTQNSIITVKLQNGTVIKGELLSESELEFVVGWDQGELRLLKNEVEVINKEEPLVFLPDDDEEEGTPMSLQQRFLALPLVSELVDWIRGLIVIIRGWFLDSVEHGIEGGAFLRRDNMVTLYLANGSAMSGELLSQDEDGYRIKWQGGLVEFSADEIVRIERGQLINQDGGVRLVETIVETWEYENEVVIKLMNGEVLDAKIRDITDEFIIVQYRFEGGGTIEQEIARSKVEYLLFKPITNDRSKEIRQSLKNLFPNMRVYDDGNVTIVTDSYITWLRKYKSLLRKTQTDIYCKFFRLFKGKRPSVQHFVVVFDDPVAYVEYAISDGVPGWAAPGYFDPRTKVLYLFNMVGEKMEDEITMLMENYYGSSIDTAVNKVKSSVDDRYHVFLEGTANDIKDKYWKYFDWWTAALRNTTTMVLRHEFAHEMFSNYGIQMVIASKFEQKDFPDLEKKKKFLDTSDPNEKSKILTELLTVRSSDKLPDMSAANSWITEGIATFCETNPMGAPNEERIYSFQEMMRNNAFLPLEQLTVYKIGSFPGVYHDAMLYAYAQSWALVRFLMEQYPGQFFNYMTKVSQTELSGNQDVEWLAESLGRDVRTIEAELIEYMKQFSEREDPVVQVLQERKKLHDSIVYFGDVKT